MRIVFALLFCFCSLFAREFLVLEDGTRHDGHISVEGGLFRSSMIVVDGAKEFPTKDVSRYFSDGDLMVRHPKYNFFARRIDSSKIQLYQQTYTSISTVTMPSGGGYGMGHTVTSTSKEVSYYYSDSNSFTLKSATYDNLKRDLADNIESMALLATYKKRHKTSLATFLSGVACICIGAGTMKGNQGVGLGFFTTGSVSTITGLLFAKSKNKKLHKALLVYSGF